MNIKMIVTDFDSTLLRKNKTISEYTLSVFQNCRDKGIKVVFATARPERNTVDFDKCNCHFYPHRGEEWYTVTEKSVANSIDDIKSFADYICDTNENDGVAKRLEEIIVKL